MRPSDLNGEPGELALLGSRCGQHDVDSRSCECLRTMFGARSRRRGTTMVVVERELAEPLAQTVLDALKAAEWNDPRLDTRRTAKAFSWLAGGDAAALSSGRPTLSDLAVGLAEAMDRMVANVPLGAVVEFRNGRLLVRPEGQPEKSEPSAMANLFGPGIPDEPEEA